MKALILAGGLGTRLSEETSTRPKPMVNIGDQPILWHIMKHLSSYGIREFIILGGYKSYVIKEYFLNYRLHNSSTIFYTNSSRIDFISEVNEEWKVTVLDTGLETGTAGRLAKAEFVIGQEEDFLLTYGDGLSDINVDKLIEQHHACGAEVTLTSVIPEGRYGRIELNNERVISFSEKEITKDSWINAGYFIVKRSMLKLITSESQSWEYDILPLISERGTLCAYKHRGFWHAMDTLRDRMTLENLWKTKSAPWKIW